uniref:Uncharacterized protein n=1 Tax=Anguilla anguilla TaxID=7936 RepID=A0A0E9WCP8_ANGAN
MLLCHGRKKHFFKLRYKMRALFSWDGCLKRRVRK